MRNLLGIISIALICLLGFKVDAASRIIDGFRDTLWGSNLYKNNKFECKWGARAAAYYCKEKEPNFNLWGIKVETLDYEMNPNKYFDSITSRFKGKENWDKIKENIAAEFGSQYKGNLANNQLIYTWDIDDVQIKLASLSSSSDPYYLTIENKKYFQPRSFQSMPSERTLLPCNLNQDEYCDDKDVAILKESINQCDKPGDYNFNSDSDLDKDGCVTEKDLDKLLSYGKTEGWIDY